MKNSLLYIALILFLSCKNNVEQKEIAPKTIHQQNQETKKTPIGTEQKDSLFLEKFIEQKNKELLEEYGSLEHQSYFDANIVYPADSTYKIINLYGEFSGATYTSFSENYIIKNNRLFKSNIAGDVFRVDKISKNNYLFYVSDYLSLSSFVGLYKVSFTNDKPVFELTKKHGNFLYDLIRNKKHTPEDFPEFDFSQNYSENTARVLNLDTTKIGVNEYYFLTDEHFLEKTLDKIDFRIYYKHWYGNLAEKILRIKNRDSIFELVLAGLYSNGLDAKKLSIKFLNDSVFAQYETNTETIQDKPHKMAYKVDSIVTKYWYDSQLNYGKLSVDSMQYAIEEISKNKMDWKNIKIYGDPFYFDEEKLAVEYFMERHNSFSDKSDLYTLNLVNLETGETIMNGSQNERFTDNFDELFQAEPVDTSLWIDVNFDGYKDVTYYNNVKSGSAGSFTDVYIYDPMSKTFGFSKLLSGYYLNIDTKNRTVGFQGRAGGGLYTLRKVHFDESSTIKYIEVAKSDYSKPKQKMILTYEKIIEGEVVTHKTKMLGTSISELILDSLNELLDEN